MALYSSPGGRPDCAYFAERDQALGCLGLLKQSRNIPLALYHRPTQEFQEINEAAAWPIERLRALVASLEAGPTHPPFRQTIDAYRAPDRSRWERERGVAPYPLEDVPGKFQTRARAAVGRDSASIGFRQTVDAHVQLDEIHEAVEAYCDLPEGTLVFFDPDTDQFWAYPR